MTLSSCIGENLHTNEAYVCIVYGNLRWLEKRLPMEQLTTGKLSKYKLHEKEVEYFSKFSPFGQKYETLLIRLRDPKPVKEETAPEKPVS